MSMTREEIIKAYEGAVFSNALSAAAGNEEAARDYELLKAGLDALRGPTREQVERIAGEWQGTADGYADGELVYDMWSCSECGYTIDTDDPDELPIVCPKCLAPMADKAVDMMLERWKEAIDGETD